MRMKLTSALNAAITSDHPTSTRGLTVFDSLGSSQVLTLNFTKTYGPQATAAGTVGDLLATDDLITDVGLSDGNTFTLSVDLGGAAITYEVDNDATVGAGNVAVTTVNDIISDINTNVPGASAFLGNDGELVIQRDDFAAGGERITLANTSGTPLTGLGITLVNGGGAGPDDFFSDDLTGGPYDNGAPGDSHHTAKVTWPMVTFSRHSRTRQAIQIIMPAVIGNWIFCIPMGRHYHAV